MAKSPIPLRKGDKKDRGTLSNVKARESLEVYLYHFSMTMFLIRVALSQD